MLVRLNWRRLLFCITHTLNFLIWLQDVIGVDASLQKRMSKDASCWNSTELWVFMHGFLFCSVFLGRNIACWISRVPLILLRRTDSVAKMTLVCTISIILVWDYICCFYFPRSWCNFSLGFIFIRKNMMRAFHDKTWYSINVHLQLYHCFILNRHS